MTAEHRDRQVAKAGVLGEHRQQRLDDARPEAVADHQSVDVARIERSGGALDAERADEPDALADGDRKLRIGAAAAGDQHGGFFERIGIRQLGHALAAGGERLHPAQHGVVQGADAQGGAEPLRDAGGCDRERKSPARQESARRRLRACARSPA